MAYGTKSIPKVDKICGPGNIYVALAKKAVFGYVSIDSVAGPSEILVIADETANPRYVAADLLSQAEHDEMASAILVTTSEDLAHKVSAEVDKFVAELSRKEIIQKSLDNYGYILVAKDIDEAVTRLNQNIWKSLLRILLMLRLRLRTQVLSSLENTVQSLLVITLQVLTTFFLLTEQLSSSHL